MTFRLPLVCGMLAMALAGCGSSAAVSLDAGSVTARPAAATPPSVISYRIPFGAKRKREMARYAKRHYGINTYKLAAPKVIIEHVAVAGTARSVYNTFANDVPDVGLHELPQVCAHFIVDGKGKIYQFVSLRVMCRHAIGMNYTAIGIEHTGFNDGDVIDNKRQIRSSLILTNWLRCQYGIKVKDVIGHNEILSSPYHHERVAKIRNDTHDDMKPATMRRYRAALAKQSC